MDRRSVIVFQLALEAPAETTSSRVSRRETRPGTECLRVTDAEKMAAERQV